MKKIISIQVWPTDYIPSLRWDDVQPTLHEVENPGEVSQAISDVTGQQVRMTYYNDATGNDVGRNNGHYFNPTTIKRFESA